MKVTLRAFIQKTTLIATAFVLAVSTLTASLPFILSQEAAAAPLGGVKQVSTSLTGSGWDFYTDGGSVPAVRGIAIDPAYVAGAENNGAVRINAGAGQKQNLSSDSFTGTNLSDITAIGYDTYITNAGSSYINIDVNFGESSYKAYNGRLVYVPAATVNAWTHTENAVNGLWSWSQYGANGNKWIDGSTAQYRTWGDIVAAFPNAKVQTVNYLFGFLKVTTGGYVHLRADQHDTYFDNVYVQKNNAAYTIHDFELPAVQVPTGLTSTSQSAEDITNGATKINYVRNSWAPVTDAVKYDYEFKKPAGLATYAQSVTVTSVAGKFHNSASPEGEYAFRVRAVIANGLVSDWSDWSTVSYDKSGPVVKIVSPTAGSAHSATVSVQGTATDPHLAANAEIKVWLRGPLNVNGNCAGDIASTITTGAIVNGEWTVAVPTTGLANGQYCIQAEAADALGNKNVNTILKSITIDTEAPTANVTYSTTQITKGNIYAYLTPSEPITVTSTNWEARPDGSFRKAYSPNNKTPNWDQIVEFKDAAGNPGTAHVYIDWLDNTTPTASITDVAVLGDTLTFEGTVNDKNLNYYYCYLTTNQTIVVDGHTFTPGQEVRLNNNADSSRNAACNTTWANGQSEFSGVLGGFNIPNVPDGSYTVKLVAHDLAGNNNAANPATYTFTLDRTAPEVAITSLTTSRIEGTAGLDATIVLTVDGTSIAPFAPEADGTWGYDFSPVLGEGTHTVVVTVFDAVGNERFATASLTVLPPASGTTEPVVVTEINNNPQVPTVPLAFGPSAAQAIQGVSTEGENDGEESALGASTEKTLADAVDANNTDGKALGLAWYWWILIVAALATIIWWIVAAVRKRSTES